MFGQVFCCYTVCRQPDPPKSRYPSGWDALLSRQAVNVPQSNLDQMSTSSRQRRSQNDHESRIQRTLNHRGGEPSVQPARNDGRGPRSVFGQEGHVRSAASEPLQGPSTPHSTLQICGSAGPTTFPTSTFPPQVSGWTSHPIQRAPQSVHKHGPTPTGHASGGRDPDRSFEAPSQMNVAPSRPGMWIQSQYPTPHLYIAQGGKS